NRYSPELRERAIRMVREHRGEYESKRETLLSIAPKIGCTYDTLRAWLRQHERDAGAGDGGLTTAERQRLNVNGSIMRDTYKSGANAAALALQNADKPDEAMIAIRQSKYLNNLVEQDHRNIKRRVHPMLGFNAFRRAQTILSDIELIHMIRKGQYQYTADDGMSPAKQLYLLVT
ncbi:DDE-type integrase/transposase/recombinase, partial [Klebsiella sp. S69]|uniref:DDE-type integrase/transposase/recombinase n=1 Tax=Klebsiella sp. S69 TaxID=2767439 RepID=UPI001D11146A